MDITTFCYYKWEKENPTEFDGMQVERFTAAYHRLEKNGMIDCVSYAGKMNCSCRSTDPLGQHYGFIINGDEDQTLRMLNVIECDLHESFKTETMEKLDRYLRSDEDYFREYLRRITA